MDAITPHPDGSANILPSNINGGAGINDISVSGSVKSTSPIAAVIAAESPRRAQFTIGSAGGSQRIPDEQKRLLSPTSKKYYLVPSSQTQSPNTSFNRGAMQKKYLVPDVHTDGSNSTNEPSSLASPAGTSTPIYVRNRHFNNSMRSIRSGVLYLFNGFYVISFKYANILSNLIIAFINDK